ncbi:PREDICTED: uncharacterized protein LOC106741010 isoform X2 [Dinoponera quadriceps]|uniref:Uncharacterized protein LOC106741010 isoform X2 n=1 Tax=Dinoponera quadriceps TaxID=609295 RepID=A0A6P3WPT2_DINQU|nr:PREDICTED: uncharacterized protein LOC106741010 isoform X2 [Dinoponera quadriceps]
MGVNVVPLVVIAMVPIITGSFEQRAIGKRSSAANGIANVDYPDYPAKYDDYPVVMPKRAALLFDQLMVALQKVVDNQGKSTVGGAPFAADLETAPVMEKDQTMDLQRRGQGKSQVYWRCYFNAVTCFRRK